VTRQDVGSKILPYVVICGNNETLDICIENKIKVNYNTCLQNLCKILFLKEVCMIMQICMLQATHLLLAQTVAT